MKRTVSVVLTMFLTALLAGVTAVLLPGSAAAHSSLENSSPAVGAELAEAPTSIVLVFNEGIRDFAPQIAITVGSQAPVSVTPTVDVDTVVADLTGVEIPRDPASALWKVGYRVVSEDGHPVAGVLEFSVLDGDLPAAGGSVGGEPSAGVTTDSTDSTDSAVTTETVDSAAPETVDTAPTSDEAGTTEPMMSIMATPSAETEPVETTSGDGHDTGSMVAWFVGGGILIVAIVVVAVVAARRRPAHGRRSGDGADGGGGDGSRDHSDSGADSGADSGGADGGGGGGGD